MAIGQHIKHSPPLPSFCTSYFLVGFALKQYSNSNAWRLGIKACYSQLRNIPMKNHYSSIFPLWLLRISSFCLKLRRKIKYWIQTVTIRKRQFRVSFINKSFSVLKTMVGFIIFLWLIIGKTNQTTMSKREILFSSVNGLSAWTFGHDCNQNDYYANFVLNFNAPYYCCLALGSKRKSKSVWQQC